MLRFYPEHDSQPLEITLRIDISKVLSDNLLIFGHEFCHGASDLVGGRCQIRQILLSPSTDSIADKFPKISRPARGLRAWLGQGHVRGSSDEVKMTRMIKAVITCTPLSIMMTGRRWLSVISTIVTLKRFNQL